MKDTIQVEMPQPGLVRVLLNRPQTGNVYDDEMVCALITALDDIADRDDVHLLWLTAQGDDFCQGPDPRWQARRLSTGRAEHQQDAEQLARLFHTLYQFPLPVIATVRGQANAAAVGLLCCCDVVIAGERASFTITETAYGLVPALQSPYLVKTLGERAARFYALSAEPMDAYTATRLGLVSRLAPENELDAVSHIYIEKMLARSALSLQQTKAMLQLAADEPFDESLVETLVDCSVDIRLTQSHQNHVVDAFSDKGVAN